MSCTPNPDNIILPAAELSIEGSSCQYLNYLLKVHCHNPSAKGKPESGEAYKESLNIFINPDSINETYEATSYWHKDILFDLFLR